MNKVLRMVLYLRRTIMESKKKNVVVIASNMVLRLL